MGHAPEDGDKSELKTCVNKLPCTNALRRHEKQGNIRSIILSENTYS
jgi:hypothetical protein